MNPVAMATMATILAGLPTALVIALNSGTTWLVARLATLAEGLFVRWR